MSEKKAKRVRAFRDVDQKIRRNPQQIRRLFFDTVKDDFECSLDHAADAFLAAVPAEERRLYHQRSLANTLYRITRDEIAINYTHLEMLARHYGIPTGLMLVFTRLQAEVRGGGLDRAGRTARAIEAGLQVIRDALDEGRTRGRGPVLGRAALTRVAQAYQQAIAPEEPQLELKVAPRPRRRSPPAGG